MLRLLEGFGHVRLGEGPLPGAGRPPARPAELEPDVWRHLTRLYGDAAERVAAAGPERIHPEGPDVWGQVHHAVDHEWACTVGDVVRRRTTLAVRGLATPEVLERIAATLGVTEVFQSVDGR